MPWARADALRTGAIAGCRQGRLFGTSGQPSADERGCAAGVDGLRPLASLLFLRRSFAAKKQRHRREDDDPWRLSFPSAYAIPFPRPWAGPGSSPVERRYSATATGCWRTTRTALSFAHAARGWHGCFDRSGQWPGGAALQRHRDRVLEDDQDGSILCPHSTGNASFRDRWARVAPVRRPGWHGFGR